MHRHSVKVRPVIAAFSRRVSTLRRAAGLTQEQLAERAFVLPNFIGQIERGQTNPSLVSIALIAAALKCDVRDLFDRQI